MAAPTGNAASTGVVATASGILAAIAAVLLLSRMWAACDVGVNASANALGLLLFTAPLVTVAGGVCAGVAFWSIVRTRKRWSVAAACVGAACATLVIVWIAVAVQHDPGGDYPAPVCVDNIPPWWPQALPI